MSSNYYGGIVGEVADGCGGIYLPAATCRKCGRPIARSPATGLWWPTDKGLPELGCRHEPQEADSEDGDPAA